MRSTIDLHIHTVFSDGTDTPDMLIEALRKHNISTFAICDHDTAEGCKAIIDFVPQDIKMISGIEFSCTTSFKKCHILGLGIDVNNTVLIKAIAEGKKLREDKLQTRLDHLESVHNITFSERDINALKSLNSVGKPHIAQLLVKYGYAEDLNTAIKTFLNFRSVNDRLDASVAIKAIKSAGGVPVWAHPLGGESDKRLTDAEFHAQLSLLRKDGIEGLECWYSRYNKSEIDFLINEAMSLNMLISGGSDYHGLNKNIVPGQLCSEDLNAPPDKINVLDRITL